MAAGIVRSGPGAGRDVREWETEILYTSEPDGLAAGAGALPGARRRCEAGKRTHGPGQRACLALLAATALLALAAPAQAQTEIWSATLTPQDLGMGALGCNSIDFNTAVLECSNTAVLSDNDFTLGSTDHTIEFIELSAEGSLQIISTGVFTDADTLVLVLGTTSLAFSDGVLKSGDGQPGDGQLWVSTGISWTAGTDVSVRLTTAATPNTAPTVANTIPNQTATAGTAFSYAFLANTFADTDPGDTLTYTATQSDDTALPSWLSFAAATRTFSGMPTAADVGTVSVKVTASDGHGSSVSDTFDIVVSAAAGVTVSKSALTVTEEDTTGNTYTVVLDSQPTANVTVTVAGHAGTDVTLTPSSSILTFTTANWDTVQTVTVTAGDDADTTDDSVTLTHSAASTDTGYSGITIAGVVVTVRDNDTAQVTGVTVDEGDAQLVVNWTAVDNATGYTVQWKSGGQGYNTDDRQATVTPGSTTSHTIEGLANGTEYTVRVIATRTDANDGPPSAEVQGTPAVPTAAGVTVSTTALTVTEADTTGGSYTVVLDSEPTATVTVTVAGHAGTDVTRTPGTLTFTTSNWDTVQTVTVTAGDDADTTDDSVTLTHSAASTDTGYSGITIAGVVVTVRDNDTAQVTGVTVDEGDAQLVVNWTAVDNATGYTVQWKSGGQGYNTDDRQATVTPGSTTSHTIEGLANGTEYTVRVIATRTDANDGPPSAEVQGTPAVPTAAGVTVSTTALTVTEADTTGGSYTVVLDSEPTATVTVTVAGHAGTDVTRTPGTLTFTTSNWDTVQTVTVTAGDDADTTDDSVTLTHSAASTDTGYSGITIAGVVVTVRDNDTAQVTGVTVDEGDAQLVVNWTAVDNATGYTVQWKSGGQGYNTDDRQATVTPGSTTSHTIEGLANGTEYTVRVIATRTDANDGPPSAEVQGTPAVPTAAGVTVSTTALTVTEADTTGGSYTVVLDSEPTATVTVTVAGHAGTDVTRTPGTLTFTTSNWDTVQTVTVTAGDDADTTDDSVTLTHSAASTDTGYSGITIAGVVVTVRDNDTAQVTGVTVDEGDAQLVVNWTAVDNATGYTVQWKSGGQGYNTDDRQATVTPGSTTSHTIEGLANGTEYTVRVIATRTDANDGPPSAEVQGTPAVPTAAGVTVSTTALTVTEADTTGGSYTVVLDSEPTATVTVTVAGHAGTDVTRTPGTLTFTTSNWDTVQTVTVTAGDDADTTDDSVTLTHSAASTDTGYSGITIAGVVVTVRDNDTAQVTGVTVDAGDAQLVVNWTAVDNATGYTVQWKSGGQGYNTDDRQATVTPGSTTSHTIEGLANGTEYSVQVSATRTDANDGPPSAEVTGTTEMIPVPTPTLPEIALLLLAMLLLGSGVYLLRGRQSGGLTHA